MKFQPACCPECDRDDCIDVEYHEVVKDEQEVVGMDCTIKCRDCQQTFHDLLPVIVEGGGSSQ
ncbi:MAG: hypothetical protein N2C12_00065 [Planctomycetales bacterium]